MLKELSLLKWQEKATKLASEKNLTEVDELLATVSNLEANVKIERCFFSASDQPWVDYQISDGICWLIYREKIQENTKDLKELEALHTKYMKRQEVCTFSVLALFVNFLCPLRKFAYLFLHFLLQG